MNITNKLLYKGCLIASISHAIMTNVYPELSYEQSWDENNYSIQNSQGLRGTITFESDYCIGAIRNENSVLANNANFFEMILSSFPLNIINMARKETLQYLLIENSGVATPSVTSMFWADNTTFNYNENNKKSLQQDISLFSRVLLSEEDAIKEWQKYYCMNSDAIALLKYLLFEKEISFRQKILLDNEKIKFIPGDYILSECIESLSELNIIIPCRNKI